MIGHANIDNIWNCGRVTNFGTIHEVRHKSTGEHMSTDGGMSTGGQIEC